MSFIDELNNYNNNQSINALNNTANNILSGICAECYRKVNEKHVEGWVLLHREDAATIVCDYPKVPGVDATVVNEEIIKKSDLKSTLEALLLKEGFTNFSIKFEDQVAYRKTAKKSFWSGAYINEPTGVKGYMVHISVKW
jgi:nitrogen regulatory protein PII-like uncharacterized protein